MLPFLSIITPTLVLIVKNEIRLSDTLLRYEEPFQVTPFPNKCELYTDTFFAVH